MQVKIGLGGQYLGPSAGVVSELLHSKGCALPLSAALLAWLLTCAGLFWGSGSVRTTPTKSDYTAFNIKPATKNIFWLFQRPAITGHWSNHSPH